MMNAAPSGDQLLEGTGLAVVSPGWIHLSGLIPLLRIWLLALVASVPLQLLVLADESTNRTQAGFRIIGVVLVAALLAVLGSLLSIRAGKPFFINRLVPWLARRLGGPALRKTPLLEVQDITDAFDSIVQIGDVILVGGTDPISRMRQWGERSSFSHSAISLGNGALCEAYDYALTPFDVDEGIFQISHDSFLSRTRTTDRIRVLRPTGIDPERLRAMASYYQTHSPSFATLALVSLLWAGLSKPVVYRLPDRIRRRILRRQVRSIGDGPQSVHDAEFVVRLLVSSGVPIRLKRPLLHRHLDYVASGAAESELVLLDIPAQKRSAAKGSWPASGLKGTAYGLRGYWRALRSRRYGDEDVVDAADFVLAGDLSDAEPLKVIYDFVKFEARWFVFSWEAER